MIEFNILYTDNYRDDTISIRIYDIYKSFIYDFIYYHDIEEIFYRKIIIGSRGDIFNKDDGTYLKFPMNGLKNYCKFPKEKFIIYIENENDSNFHLLVRNKKLNNILNE